MYLLSVEREFCAAHALRFASGVVEPLHGHNFRCTLTVSASSLDRDGLVVDFHALEAALDRVLAPLTNANINDHPAFARVSPSAEHIARLIAEQFEPALAKLDPSARRVALQSVRLTEAPGCSVTYTPGPRVRTGPKRSRRSAGSRGREL
jgi:6-pyruvoyltetrahydropterin/6-carboxytetrahydropterin synthase